MISRRGPSPSRRPPLALAVALGALVAGGAALSLASAARAQTPSSSQDPVDPGPRPRDRADHVWESCTERVPSGATRPTLTETFPDRGTSGYAASLVVTVTHGKGETVFPAGFKVHTSSDAIRMLQTAGFVVPDQDGGSPARIEREDKESRAVTKVTIPFVPLPPDPGRTDMILPPMPIAIARASGEVITVCTKPHAIRVEDPTANDPDPKVKPNAPPRPQREEWELARQLTYGAIAGAVAMALAIWAFLRWRRRPRVVKLPPPRLPWLVALDELAAIRRSSLLADG
ncbi:MAG: hypothetical protein R3F14_21110, partial [Polyangiaceae bacterium]